ncbi:DNA mismatch repair protein MutS [candidate division WOR-3 bacterium]|uniref:DNA mismatch repair protein MutS n=1 Tax=candidate division WOR-3 bacterium TaxID=2052148 RepID=A0A9D5KD71_UNCW3|nr:DNA mismatch repair protein MutS [candidate division WOR-3 bacterium]MBD3365436.1 DNA mismatch repair protein MutS [candidate division WOR-3 bacterium]
MADLTPLLRQYHEIKRRYPDALLFFRMGDFYEMMYDDAKNAARVLGITLTSRSYGDNPVPLAGVPVKSYQQYLTRLVKQGLKVAICEQVELPDPKKKLLKRDVTEVITPGTITSEEMLEAGTGNYLAAVVTGEDDISAGIAYADVSTGDFVCGEARISDAAEHLAKIAPRELLVGEGEKWRPGLFETRLQKVDAHLFDEDLSKGRLLDHFKVAALEGLGLSGKELAVRAAGAVLAYLTDQKKSLLPHIDNIRVFEQGRYLVIDEFTQRNLELLERQRDRSSEGSVFSIINKTLTACGIRLLKRWLIFPLNAKPDIQARLDAVEELFTGPELRNEVAGLLKQTGDPERLVAKIATQRANPREVRYLARILRLGEDLRGVLVKCKSKLLTRLAGRISDFTEIAEDIEKTIKQDPSLMLLEGGIICECVDSELDELRSLAHNAREHIARLQLKERSETGIEKLKVGYNSVFGYYIEIPRSRADKAPSHYIRKQTLVSAERFFTPELKELEQKISSAEERSRIIEYEMFLGLRERLAAHSRSFRALAEVVAETDVLYSFAECARANDYVRPEIDEGNEISVHASRHPVVEKLLAEQFIPNRVKLDTDENMVLLVTGPNMSGKSTYLRQVALTVIMAQMGSFVPAKKARIGLVDKIFTRIGASDDLSRGVSTFLAEMAETANILRSATPSSLVILDEIGRGTSTYDGMAIAWAVIEYLHSSPELRPKTLFATHYHELTELADYFKGLRNVSFSVKRTSDGILFLRKLRYEASDQSYGIEVARLAGLPRAVIERARFLLERIYKGETVSIDEILTEKKVQLRFFTGAAEDEIAKELRELDLDNLSPIEALQKLIAWQEKLNED